MSAVVPLEQYLITGIARCVEEIARATAELDIEYWTARREALTDVLAELKR